MKHFNATRTNSNQTHGNSRRHRRQLRCRPEVFREGAKSGQRFLGKMLMPVKDPHIEDILNIIEQFVCI